MFVIALQNYLKTRLRYIILRKSDFFVRILKKFIAQEIINKYIYLFIIQAVEKVFSTACFCV
ncbi:hypothetical protein BM74_00275 [Bacillus thuringiensis]|uniref:Uncharacterized protein n=1 Tax=Bacillus thuringiensis TaxID=1428 RepID=A0A437SS28_BACTU|nr:hypothetical protein BM74_00275 [Bacillus thuringiensis]